MAARLSQTSVMCSSRMHGPAQPSASRIVFGRDGKIYMTIGVPFREHPAGEVNAEDAQNPGATLERCCGSMMTAASRAITRSRAEQVTSRRSTRSVFATRSDSSSIQKQVRSGKTRTVLRAATRSTSSGRVATTAGQSSRMAAPIPVSSPVPSLVPHPKCPSRLVWSSRCSIGCLRLPCRA